MEADTVTQSLQSPQTSAGTVLNMTASSIADELADREQRKNNLIIYNLPEESDCEINEKLLAELCKTVFSDRISARPYFRFASRQFFNPSSSKHGTLHTG